MKGLFPRFCRWIKKLAKAESGGVMVEYVLLVALIGFGATAGLRDFAGVEKKGLQMIGSTVDQVGQGQTPTGCLDNPGWPHGH